MTDGAKRDFKLGLIGDNIARSQSPRLHVAAGELTGHNVTYDRLIPKDLGLTFREVFENVADLGYDGINVTYPYKERVTEFVDIQDPLVRAIGAVNTVVFGQDKPLGYNTDYSGFMRAYRMVRGDTPPGSVCLIGTGGVGKAVAFGLIALGVSEIRFVELVSAKADALLDAIRKTGTKTRLKLYENAASAANGADGLINCTPMGMSGIGGTPLPREDMDQSASWAFDAVYTPVETQFLTDAAAQGLSIISGYELFFGQGVDAWQIFTGIDLDHVALRTAIEQVNT